MAAGQGFKEFVTGEVLTAGDVNGYLMQGVLVFASAAARNAAITSPQEGQFAYTKDTNGLWYYDGAAWVASGATGDIEGVTAGVGISGGGTSGTVTITNSMATAIDAKGDLVAGTGADAFSRIAVGTNGQVLKANSATATGLEWGSAAATGAGCQATNGGQSCASGSQTVLAFNVETFDTDAYHDNTTNNSRFTIPTGKGGLYIITASAQIPGATGGRAIGFRKNGVVMTNNTGVTFGTVNTYAAGLCASMVERPIAGDYYELYVEHTNGSAVTCTANFSLGYLGA